MSVINLQRVRVVQNCPPPEMALVCDVCHRPLYGDWEYNFTNPMAHVACRNSEGELLVTVKITGLFIAN